jgi:hypothetical protein
MPLSTSSNEIALALLSGSLLHDMADGVAVREASLKFPPGEALGARSSTTTVVGIIDWFDPPPTTRPDDMVGREVAVTGATAIGLDETPLSGLPTGLMIEVPEGASDGTSDGQSEGRLNGLSEGARDGQSEATLDEFFDGARDVPSDDALNRVSDGATDGAIDGKSDGTPVGASA